MCAAQRASGTDRKQPGLGLHAVTAVDLCELRESSDPVGLDVTGMNTGPGPVSDYCRPNQ